MDAVTASTYCLVARPRFVVGSASARAPLSVGAVAKTSAPEPVSSEITPASSADVVAA